MNAALVFSSAFEATAGRRAIFPQKIGAAAKLAPLVRLTYIRAAAIEAPRRTKVP